MSEAPAGGERLKEQQKDISELAQDVVAFLNKLDGIDYSVIVSEGFPLAYTGMDQERAETAAALAVDLATAAEIYIADLINEEINSVVVYVRSGRAISVARSKGLLLLIEGQRRITEEAMRISTGYLEGQRIHCPYCNYDLTLEVYKCPRCGRTIPFRSDVCPFCGRVVRFKKCPNCGRLVTGTGRKVELVRSGEAIKVAAIEGFIGGVIIGSLGYIVTFNPLVAVLAGVIGGALIGAFTYRNAPREPVARVPPSGEENR